MRGLSTLDLSLCPPDRKGILIENLKTNGAVRTEQMIQWSISQLGVTQRQILWVWLIGIPENLLRTTIPPGGNLGKIIKSINRTLEDTLMKLEKQMGRRTG
jgi:hypothetical protein